VSTAQSYRFVFEKPEAWFIATINDSTCELLITSDYGNYAHRWPNAFGGRTLTEFLASKGREQYDCDYIVNKLRTSTRSKELDEVVDDAATRTEVAGRIIKARREQELSMRSARSLWDDMESWIGDDCNMEALSSELAEFLGGQHEAWGCIRHKPSGWYLVLRDELLPFFCRWLRENVVNKAAKAVANA
jgi:hypothetical protein